jgi:hypothetical protein
MIFFNIISLLFEEGIKCKVYIRASPHRVGDRAFLALQQIKMDFSVKHIRMGVENVHNGNSVIRMLDKFKYLPLFKLFLQKRL